MPRRPCGRKKKKNNQKQKGNGILPICSELPDHKRLQNSKQDAPRRACKKTARTPDNHGHKSIDENGHAPVRRHAHIIGGKAGGKSQKQAAESEHA